LSRARTAAIALFVLVVIVLWLRHQRAREEKNRGLTEVLATANAKEARRVDALREAVKRPMPEPARPCPVKTRVRIVRLATIDARGGRLHDVVAAIAEEREPKPWSQELDVVDGRAFLYDYDADAVVCVGRDADDPHGTLVAY
jgi:hypothetical protein